VRRRWFARPASLALLCAVMIVAVAQVSVPVLVRGGQAPRQSGPRSAPSPEDTSSRHRFWPRAEGSETSRLRGHTTWLFMSSTTVMVR